MCPQRVCPQCGVSRHVSVSCLCMCFQFMTTGIYIFTFRMQYFLQFMTTLTFSSFLQSLNAQSRALLMQKLDRSGIATRFVCYLTLILWVFSQTWHGELDLAVILLQRCGVSWSSNA